MKILSQESFNQLLNSGYTRIEMNVDRHVRSAIPDFLHLTEEDESYRKKWLVDLSGESRDPDDGLIERRREEGKDEKFFFHYRPHLKKNLIGKNVDIRRYDYFLEQCQLIFSFCSEAAERVINDLNQAFPKYLLSERIKSRDESTRHVLRFLRYKPGTDIKAGRHCDQSFITLAPAESDPGLYLNEEKEFYKAEEGTCLLFLGEKAEILTSKELMAVPHHVEMNPDEWRWSVVFFTHIDIGISDQAVRDSIERKRKAYAALL
jgi:hypothetical protein